MPYLEDNTISFLTFAAVTTVVLVGGVILEIFYFCNSGTQ